MIITKQVFRLVKQMRIVYLAMLITLSSLSLRSQEVNKFNGTLNYSVPIMSVPNSAGPAINVVASYSSGIKVNQSASEIGLGWSLNTSGFMVSRIVDGYNDVDELQYQFNKADKKFELNNNFYSFGTTSDFSSQELEDIKKDLLSAIRLRSDKFYFSTPFKSGEIEASFHRFDGVYYDETGKLKSKSISLGSNDGGELNYYIKEDYSGKYYSNHYPSLLNANTPFKWVGSTATNCNSQTDYTAFSPGINCNEGYNNVSNLLTTKSLVEVFLNHEIESAVSTGKILDYQTTHNRNAHKPLEIGAFKITDENGLVYHFSLPVYLKYVIDASIPLQNNYTFYNSYGDISLNFTGVPSVHKDKFYFIKGTSPQEQVYVIKTGNIYAVNWLLTAITGPDYEDYNDNGIADEGDKGYWTSFDWKLWSNDFNSRYPFLGSEYKYAPDPTEPSYNKAWDASDKLSGKYAYYSKSGIEIYYLNKIVTPSHSALFVRDVRNDNYSSPLNEENISGIGVYRLPSAGSYASLLHYSGTIKGDSITSNYMASGTKSVHISPFAFDSIRFEISNLTNFGLDAGQQSSIKFFKGNSTSSSDLVAELKYDTARSFPCYVNIPTGYTATVQINVPSGINSRPPAIKYKACFRNPTVDSTVFPLKVGASNGIDYFYDSNNSTWNTNPLITKAGTFEGCPGGCAYSCLPVNYQNNVIKWRRISPVGANKVKVTINCTGFSGSTSGLKIYDGAYPTSTNLVYTRDGNSSTPFTYTSSGPDVCIAIYQTGGSQYLGSFSLTWEGVYDNGNGIITPELAVKKVLLLRNEDLASLTLPSTMSLSSTWNNANCNYVNYVPYHLSWYNTYKTTIDNLAINQTDFTQDYSLCRKYFNNINTCFVGSITNFIPQKDLLNKIDINNTNYNYNTSGKLTLTEIAYYNKGYYKVQPSILFDYNQSNSNDNPDYDPTKVDYFGYYKSDVSNVGASSYTTSTSKDYTDAWSLRKITNPLGGSVEIVYESNSYKYVHSGKGGLRGPRRFYLINKVNSFQESPTGYYGKKFSFELEDNTTDAQSLLANSPVSGSKRKIHLPLVYTPTPSGDPILWFSSNWMNTSDEAITCSADVYTSSNTSDKMTLLQGFTLGQVGNSYYYSGNEGENKFDNISQNSTYDIDNVKYTLNGFVAVQLPRGNEVYGFGSRVKQIKNINESEIFVTEYNYYDGVATSEIDRFNHEALYEYEANTYYANKLIPISNHSFMMAPSLGYSKVTESSKNLNNETMGMSETYFLTNDTLYDNFKIRFKAYANSTNDTVNEISNKFSALWGVPYQINTYDRNGVLVSRTQNYFETSDFGATTELFGWENGIYLDYNRKIVCIHRNYKSILTKSETFNAGGLVSSEEFKNIDPILGAPTYTLVSGQNKTVKVNRFSPAFRLSAYSSLGPKTLNVSNKNQIAQVAESQVYSDTVLTGNTDFDAYSVSKFSNSINTRYFDTNDLLFKNSTNTKPYYLNTKQYAWIGPESSSGLFKRNQFVAFNHSSTNGNNWREMAENTLYNEKGGVLEIKQHLNRYSANRYSVKNNLLQATVSNSNYSSFTFSGFENKVDINSTWSYTDGELVFNKQNNILVDNTVIAPHTGLSCIRVSAGAYGPTFKTSNVNGTAIELQRGRIYRISVWVHKDSPNDCGLIADLTGSNNGTPGYRDYQAIYKNSANGIQIGDWIQLNLDVTVPDNYVSANDNGVNQNDFRMYVVGGTGGYAYFDDFMFRSADSEINATVFNDKINRVDATIDNNNFATFYKYDLRGYKVETLKELEGVGIKKLNKLNYNFSRGL